MAKNQPSSLEPELLAEIVEEAVEFMRPELRRHAVELDLEIDPATPLVRADDAQLKQAFLKVHGDLMTADWWRGIQQRLKEGELLEVLPYHKHRVRVFGSL